jgi:hypothetical protein
MKKYLPLILLAILILPSVWWLFGSGYFNMHDDLQAMRLLQMDKCFADGQIPCRWSPDMAYGYGQAMFNFYSAFPYYLGSFLRILLPLTYLGTVKLLFIIAFAGGALGMYLLAREFWGRLGGILSAVLYTYAPYHALDIYVRGAMAESFALAILPFLWFFFYRLIKYGGYGNIAGTTLSLFALLTTHNISTMLYAPLTVLWVGYWVVATGKFYSLKNIAVAGFMGVGLASFFIIPALYEQSYINAHLFTVDYYDFRGHFVTLRQLFLDRSWGDGPSIFGDQDEISFQIGWPHWWLGIVAGVYALHLWVAKKRRTAVLVAAFLGLTVLSAFLTHSRSIVIWDRLPYIGYVQFPWRFLGLTIFFLSFAGGALAVKRFLFRKPAILLLLIIIIILNFRYFIPVNYSRFVTDEEKLTGEAFVLQQKAAILDYLPTTAEKAPEDVAFAAPQAITGAAETKNFTKGSDRFSFNAEVYETAEIEIPVMYFPGWKLLVNDNMQEPDIHGEFGLIKTPILETGNHEIRGIFLDTPVRVFANAITTFSAVALLAGTVLVRKKK